MLPKDPSGIPPRILGAPSARESDTPTPRSWGDLSEGPAYGGKNQKTSDPVEMPETDAYWGMGTPA